MAQLAERPTELLGESSQIVGSELQCFQMLTQWFQVENGQRQDTVFRFALAPHRVQESQPSDTQKKLRRWKVKKHRKQIEIENQFGSVDLHSSNAVIHAGVRVVTKVQVSEYVKRWL